MKENKMSDSSSTHEEDGKYRMLRSFVEKIKTAPLGTSRHMSDDNIKI